MKAPTHIRSLIHFALGLQVLSVILLGTLVYLIYQSQTRRAQLDNKLSEEYLQNSRKYQEDSRKYQEDSRKYQEDSRKYQKYMDAAMPEGSREKRRKAP